jgi:hypothetical protein
LEKAEIEDDYFAISQKLIPYMYKWDFANNSYAKYTLEI